MSVKELIRRYQCSYDCRLVVLSDVIFSESVTLFEEVLHDADPSKDLHVVLSTPGGGGETAIRLIRQAQSRCKELTVVVPDQAKSAGTLFVLGADNILMGPTSDLGPVDPQFLLPDGSLAAARAIIAAVEDAETRIQANPQTYPLHASLLADISALMVQQARDALARTAVQVKEALSCAAARDVKGVRHLASALDKPLVSDTQSHSTTISGEDAAALGLPVKEASASDRQWQDLWRLWMKYRALGEAQIYESHDASIVIPRNPPT